MGRTIMSLEDLAVAAPKVDLERVEATTDEDIRRHQIEDGEDPDAALPPFRAVPNVKAIRARLHMTQETFAKAICVPLATVRNWEQARTGLDPAVRALLRVVEREPDAALRALGE